jgi:hypothetical protein
MTSTPEEPTPSYARQKFSHAVDWLDESDRPLRRRLLAAARCLPPLQPTDFPSGELRRAYVSLQGVLGRRRTNLEEGALVETIRAMDDAMVSWMADKIRELYKVLVAAAPEDEYGEGASEAHPPGCSRKTFDWPATCARNPHCVSVQKQP